MLIKSKQVDFVDMKKAKPVHFVRSRFDHGEAGNGNGNGNGSTHKFSEAAAQRSEYEQKLKAAGNEAYEKGFSDGLKKGIDLESEKVRSALKSLASAMGEFEQAKREFISTSEKELLELVLAAAECIIHREIKVNRDTVCSVLNAALKKVLDRDGIRIRVNPEDYRYLTEDNPGALNGGSLKKSSLVEDETISRGGVVIETLFGEVDASVETQINELKQALVMKEV